ncbi:MAG: PIG-L deacetylase family protein [Victivallaceae bacterium]
MKKRAIAIACHPDDIEFMMAGTLLRLQAAGYEIHYMNIANGSLGTNRHTRDEIVAIRRAEAIEAAGLIGAVYHESICDDLEVFYNPELLGKTVEVVREVDPEIVLTHGPYDYMEDHVNAGRLAVSATFCRGMTNFKCGQMFPPTLREVAVYHSMPHSLTDPLRRPIIPEIYVDISSTMAAKRAMLACHRSQKQWLDVSQGADAYLEDMAFRGAHYGKLSGKYPYAEGWLKHSHVGFGAEDFDPLSKALNQ